MNDPALTSFSKVTVLVVACLVGCSGRNLSQVDGGPDTGSSAGTSGSGIAGTSAAGTSAAGTGAAGNGLAGAPSMSGAGGAAGMVGAMGQCPDGIYRTPPPNTNPGGAGTTGAGGNGLTTGDVADPTTSTPFAVASPTDYPVPQGTLSMAIGDVSGDGKPDVVTGGWNSVGVLLNKGDGSLSFAGSYTMNDGANVNLGDLTGDGKLDIVAVTGSDVFVFASKGDGKLIQPIAAANLKRASGLHHPALADVNLDGKLDVVALEGGGQAAVVAIMLNQGDGTFDGLATTPAGQNGYALAVGLVDGDTCPDFVVANPIDDALTLVLGNCSGGALGTRTMRTGGHPSGVAIGRLDKTSSTWDLLTSITNRADVDVFRGKPAAGTFEPIVRYDAGAGTKAVALGDVNGDGHTDAVVALVGGIGVLLNKGDGTFEPPRTATSPCGPREPSTVIALGLADFDGDGKLDVAETTSVLSFVTVFLNRL